MHSTWIGFSQHGKTENKQKFQLCLKTKLVVANGDPVAAAAVVVVATVVVGGGGIVVVVAVVIVSGSVCLIQK